jgi:uncharacterized membrane protein YebE (DUF533 family)
MNRVIATAALVTITTLTATSSAFAWGSSTREIDSRQANQEQRIRDGIRDGSLTRREAEALIVEQRRIQDLESAAKRDGYISRSERATIDRAQDNASRHIYQERHDSDNRRNRWFFWRSSYDHSHTGSHRRWWH